MKHQMVTFKIDDSLLKDTEKILKKAVDLPRRKITKIVKTAMHTPMAYAKYTLENAERSGMLFTRDRYKMHFKNDGATWTTDDIIDNLFLKLERRGGKDKKVYRLGIRDWRVDLYANFVEFGFTNPRTGEVHNATFFMRDSLDETAGIVYDFITNQIIKELEELGLLE